MADRSQKINADARKYGGTNLITFYYGILNLVQGDDELAVFVRDEIVHLLKQHLDQRAAIYAVGGLIQLGIAIVGAARGVNTTGLQRGVAIVTKIVDIRYTREQEREADYWGLYAAHQAGFNVNAAPFVWERFAVALPQTLNDSFLNNHPPSPERFVRVQKTIEEIRQGRTLQQAWLGEPSDTQLASNIRNSSSIPIPDYVPRY